MRASSHSGKATTNGADFAFVQHVVSHGGLPDPTTTRVSREVQESRRLVPLPWVRAPKDGLTNDTYWKLAPEQRALLQSRLRELPREWANLPATEAIVVYEGQHPPLYYWLMSPFLRLAAGASLPARVMILRWLSVLIASLVVPLGFLIARRVFADDGLALGCAAIIALMPELAIDIARVGNECLAIVFFSLVVYATQRENARLLGVSLGLGLLTKAYLLTALPALAVIFVWRRKNLRSVLTVAASAAALAGWWYWRTHALTGSWSGQLDDAALGRVPLVDLLRYVPHVRWRIAVDSTFCAHIWTGAWSFLGVRSWVYHFFALIVLAAGTGLAIKRPPNVFPLVVFYFFFGIGLAYHVLVTFANQGISATCGWYLYSLVAAEVVLATAGLTALLPARWVLPAGAFCFAALDIFTVHFILLPYYTGLISHLPSGMLPVSFISRLREVGLAEVLARTVVNKPFGVGTLLAIWTAYVAATIATVVIAARIPTNSNARSS